MVNFLALLGWNPGDDTEVMSMKELIAKFSFKHCSRAGAKFAFEKGKWFNHTYLQNLDDTRLAELFKPVMQEHGVEPSAFSDEYIAAAVGMVKSRINFVSDLWEHARFFFAAPTEYDPKAVKKRWSAEMPTTMEALVALLKTQTDFSAAALEPVVMKWIADNEMHLGNVMNAFRLCVVGECKGPHMFDITALLGSDKTIARLQSGIANIKPEE